MKQSTKDRIFEFTLGFVSKAAQNLPSWQVEDLKRAYPFYPLFLSYEELIGFKKERSFTTKFGQGFYPELAKIVAEDTYKKVFREREVKGDINSAAYEMLEQIVTELRHKQRTPNHPQELKHSSGPHHQDSGEAKIRECTAGVSRKPSSDGKACGCSSKHLCGLTAWNT